MDSRAVADALGTDPKTLRRFLRSSSSSVEPVGSGGRYVFQSADLPTIKAEFKTWMQTVVRPVASTPAAPAKRNKRTRRDIDQAVWAEEGDVFLPDIRNPAVRAEVRAAARMYEDRLNALLLAKGLHVTQMRDRVPV